MAESSPRILATAGHIDHGKSTLVEALTGFPADRLLEEKRRGLTIELGFAHFDLPDSSADRGGFRVGLVDVPGHADFVRTMLAGAGAIDAALLAVAADDLWMPQTEEHLQILLYLGVASAVIALTKSDLTADLPGAIAAIRGRLAGTPFADSAIVPTCAPQGEGLAELRTALSELFRQTTPPADCQKARLFVDRAFSPRGVGTVITGTVTGGCFHVGEDVLLQSTGELVRIRQLQNHGRSVDAVRPGMRAAMNLSGVAVSRASEHPGLRRGDVLEAANLAAAPLSKCIHLQLWRSSRLNPPFPSLRHAQRVWVHHGTGAVTARLLLIETAELFPGHICLAELRFARPLACFAGDSLVIRDISKRHTLAGGLVLDALARPRSWKAESVLRCLKTLASHPHDPTTWLRALLERDGLVDPTSALLRSRFSTTDVETATSSLAECRRINGLLVHPQRWQKWEEAAGGLIRAFHREFPRSAGLPLTDLRRKLEGTLPIPSVLESLLATLESQGFRRQGTCISAPGFIAEVAPEVRAARRKIRFALADQPFNPPRLAELIHTNSDREALHSLQQAGDVTALSDEITVLAKAYQEMKSAIVTLLRRQGRATVAEIKECLNSSRRVVVPLCERLDREGFTRRHGDFRTLHPAVAANNSP